MSKKKPPVDAAAARGEADEAQLVTFFLGHEEFGVPIAFVKEIVRVPEITRIPKAPPYVEGIANLRGSILPIVNLRRRFDMEDAERSDDNRVVVVEVSGRITGLVVDEVSEVMRVNADCIEPPPPVVSAAVDESYLRGVAKLKGGERLTILLAVEQVVPSEEVDASVARGAARSRTSTGKSDVEARAVRQAVDSEQVVSFRVADEEYAVAIADVQEIIRVPDISRVPKMPSFVEGLVSLRNRLLPIVNLRSRFGLDAAEGDEDDRRVIVLSLGGVITGLLVDSVAEVLSVARDSVEPAPEIVSSTEADRLRGVAKLEEGKRLIMLLDGSRLLSSKEVSQLSAISDEEVQSLEDKATDAGMAGRHSALDEEQFVGFRVEDEEFGIGIQQVQEIINLPEITRVPRAPYFVEGIINLRGSVLPVIDLRRRFELPSSEATDSTSIVIVDVEGKKTGVIVDAMSGVLRVRRDAIENPPAVVASGVDGRFVRGVGKLLGGQRMLIVLDVTQVLQVENERTAA